MSRPSGITIFVAATSSDADEIRRKVLHFIDFRDPVITDAFQSHSATFIGYRQYIVNRKDAQMSRFICTNHCGSRNFCFQVLMAPKRGVSRVYLDLYATGATFYVNFYSSESCVAFTALCFMLVCEVL